MFEGRALLASEGLSALEEQNGFPCSVPVPLEDPLKKSDLVSGPPQP